MSLREWFAWSCLPVLTAFFSAAAIAPACCPAPLRGKHVVNADQTVILIWNPDTQTQHFIRQASFKSDGNDVGFIVPTPNEPELAESQNNAFESLARYTAPRIVERAPSSGGGLGCSSRRDSAGVKTASTRVLQEKQVAGYNAVVLESDSADSLATWLSEHGYAFSPEVAAWAKPYIEQNWKFTALKVADPQAAASHVAAQRLHMFNAPALRITFQTDRPLFPYREPDMTADAAQLAAKDRLLRIYFLSHQRYEGDLTKEQPWTGKVVWSNALNEHQCRELHQQLGLPEKMVPLWWLTEFEDHWPYRPAPADLYFAATKENTTVARPDKIAQASPSGAYDVMPIVIIGALLMPVWWTRQRRS